MAVCTGQQGRPSHLLSMWHATQHHAVKQQGLPPPSPVQPSSQRGFSSRSGGRGAGGRPGGGTVRPVQSRVVLEVEAVVALAAGPCSSVFFSSPSEQGSGTARCSGEMPVQAGRAGRAAAALHVKPAAPGMVARLIYREVTACPTACSGWTCLRAAPGCGAASTPPSTSPLCGPGPLPTAEHEPNSHAERRQATESGLGGPRARAFSPGGQG